MIRNINIFIALFVSLITLNCFSQSKKIDANISKLDNNQFMINHDAKASFTMKSAVATKLIKTGKSASEKLILALDDPSRNIMAHLVLCHIYFKYASFAGPKTYSGENGEIQKYFLGQEKGEGLIISETGNKIYIETSDLEKIKTFWKKKIKG